MQRNGTHWAPCSLFTPRLLLQDMKEIISRSLEETQKIAKEWLADLSSSIKDGGKATVVGLSGHLGAGKTAFVKAVAQELGISETVTSPTFVIMKIYEIKKQSAPPFNISWKRMIHIDAYRLDRGEEMEALGFADLIADPANLVFIEWPENIKKAMMDIADLRVIRLSILDENAKAREFVFE